MGPFSNDATLVWLLLGLLVLIGVALVRLSRQQPFPEPSFRYGSTLLVVGALLAPPRVVMWLASVKRRPLGAPGDASNMSNYSPHYWLPVVVHSSQGRGYRR